MKQVFSIGGNSLISVKSSAFIKSTLFLYLILFPVFLQAQSSINFSNLPDSNDVFSILDAKWRFIDADDSAMAAPDYNDSNWALVYTELKGDSAVQQVLGDIGWFRTKLYITDSIADLSFAMSMEHYGASEVYLDGKLLKKYGKIGTDEKSSKYKNPVMQPYVFHFSDTGVHTLAVRFANFRDKPQLDDEDYIHGFHLSINEANKSYKTSSLIRMAILGIFLLLGGIFITLSGLHFLLWVFHTNDRSNLYLSIVCLAFCIYFFMLSYWTQASDVHVFTKQKNTTAVLLTVVLVALSVLLNDLFGRIRFRFITIAALCVVSMLLTIFDVRYNGLIAAIAMVTVMAEASVLIISAIRDKVKGAKILAVGILPLAVSTLIIHAIRIFFSDNLESVGTHSPGGFASIFIAIFAVLLFFALAGIPLSMSAFLAWRFASVNKSLSKQLTQVKKLSEQTQKQEDEKKRILENQKEQLEQEVAERTSEIVEEKKKSDDLLHNILPEEVATELKERGATTAHQFDHVTVIFTDFVNFTQAGERMGSQALVEELHNCFKAFDEIMSTYGIEKIKTIGDAYLAVCGLPTADERHAEKVVSAAKEIQSFMKNRHNQLGDKTFEIRIGIHSGEVVAGIVGVKKFAYDIWGDTVNTAARMEQNSEAGKINISQTTYNLVQDKFTCTYRGELEAKNKGKLKMYFVEE